MSKDFKVKNGLQVTTNITASGNISSSGDITTTGDLRVDASASIGPAFFNSTYGTDGTLQVKSTTSDSGVPSAIYLEEVSGGEGWRIGIDSAGDLNFYNSTGTGEIVSFQDSNKVHVVGDISTSTDIYAGDDIFAGDDLFLGHKNTLGVEETSPSINFHSGSNGATFQLIRYSTDGDTFTIGRNHQTATNIKLRLTVHNENTLSSMTIKSGSDNSLVGINNDNPTEALDVLGNIKVSGSSTSDFIHLNNTGEITASGNISSSGTVQSSLVNTLGITLSNNGGAIVGNSGEDYMTFSANNKVEIGDPSGAANSTNLTIDDANTKFVFDGGFVDITGTTDATNASGDTGILRVEGGASIAKKVFVGTDLNIGGSITSNITASGNISSSGTIIGNLGVIGTDTPATNMELTVKGDISASGNIHGNAFQIKNISSDVLLNPGGLPFMSYEDDGVKTTRLGSDDLGGTNLSRIEVMTNAGETMYVSHSSVQMGNGANSPSAIPATLHVKGDISSSGAINTLSHITASGNISASGTITMLTASIGGGIFTSASLAAGGGGGAVSAVANGSNNRIATFSSADALNGEANLTFDGSTLSVTGNQTISSHITASGNISASGGIITAHEIIAGAGTFSANIQANGNIVGDDATDIQAINDITAGGVLDLQGTTDATDASGDTGILRVEGGASIAKKVFVGTDLSVGNHITASGNISGSSTSNITVGGTITGNVISTGAGENGLYNTGAGNNKLMISSSQDILLNGADDIFFQSEGTTIVQIFGDEAKLAVTGELQVDDININGSVISDAGDFTIDSGGDITLDADGGDVFFMDNGATKLAFNTTGGHITASGNISGSSTSTLSIGGAITATDPTLTYASASIVGLANAEGYGEIIQLFPAHASVNAGDVVFHLGSVGDVWRAGTAASSYAVNMAGVAFEDGDGSTPAKILLKGVVRLAAGHIEDTSGTEGEPLYVGDSTGHVAFAAPGSANEYARIVGYCLVEADDIIYFNPDNAYVERS